jgi:hypothetical protein
MDFSVINILAVLVSGVASLAIGGIWYSPLLFGRLWQMEVALSDERIKSSNMVIIFGTTFVLSLFMSLCLALFFGGKVGFTDGLLYGFFTGLFWVSTAFGVSYLFERRSFLLWLINAGYNVVTFTVMGGIIGGWK